MNRSTLRSLIALCALCSSLPLAGCCAFGSRGPDAARYFNRKSPELALLGFTYSIETHNWDYAFASLDAASREQVETPLRLMVGTTFYDEPTTGHSIQDLIVESIQHRLDPATYSSTVQTFDLVYWVVDDDDDEPYPDIVFTVFLLKEGEEWFVDMAQTVQYNWGSLEEEDIEDDDAS